MSEERRALFIGSKQLGLKALQVLQDSIKGCVACAVTIDDSVDPRSTLPDFQSYCASIGLPLSVLRKPSELAEVVRMHTPYCVFVVGWYWLINANLLNAVPGGFVGVHASLLPKYRGNAPLVWALLRGDKETGVSLFYFEEGMDTGDIVDQVSFSIGNEETISDILKKAESATTEVLGKHAGELLSGTAPRRKQNDKLATYVSLRRPEDGRIDWNRSAVEVCNFIRAQTRPYPGAFTHLPTSKLLRIWRATLFPYPYNGVPGLVGQRANNGVVVSCGDGAVVVQEVELDEVAHPVDLVLKWGVRVC